MEDTPCVSYIHFLLQIFYYGLEVFLFSCVDMENHEKSKSKDILFGVTSLDNRS